ncbi:MAG: septum formation family protein, partial [Nocardioides sp.]
PETAEGVLLGRPDDKWLVCVNGESVDASPKIPCSEEHSWRAVTTIKLGESEDEYPGDRLVEVRTRDFCSDSVGAWLNYPVTYDFGYTWFHESEWAAGNRRSVCWAKTDS